MSQQQTDRSCHGPCMGKPRAKPSAPDAPAAEPQNRYAACAAGEIAVPESSENRGRNDSLSRMGCGDFTGWVGEGPETVQVHRSRFSVSAMAILALSAAPVLASNLQVRDARNAKVGEVVGMPDDSTLIVLTKLDRDLTTQLRLSGNVLAPLGQGRVFETTNCSGQPYTFYNREAFFDHAGAVQSTIDEFGNLWITSERTPVVRTMRSGTDPAGNCVGLNLTGETLAIELFGPVPFNPPFTVK